MAVAPIIKKIPGKPAKFEHEKDGYIDLINISKIELLDSLERENKLLNNKKFIDKLPDKGEKIKNFRARVEKELKKRDEPDKLCSLFGNLNVNDSKEALNKLEWTGDSKLPVSNETENSPENGTDPFEILVTHSGTSVSKEKVVKIEEPLTLVQPSDITEDHLDDFDVDLYAKQLCHRLDNKEMDKKKKFYPHRSLNKTFTRSKPREKEPESSAAYVPKNISGQTKLISLEESMIIHQEQSKHLKEVEMLHAFERLMQKKDIKITQPKNFINTYREQHREDSDDEESDVTEEHSDEEDGEKSYNLSDVD